MSGNEADSRQTNFSQPSNRLVTIQNGGWEIVQTIASHAPKALSHSISEPECNADSATSGAFSGRSGRNLGGEGRLA